MMSPGIPDDVAHRNEAAPVASLAGRWICVTGDGGWSSLLVLFASCPAHAFAGEFDAVGIVNETVQDGVGIGRITVHGRAPQSSIGWCPMSRLLTRDIPCLAASLRCCRSARDEVPPT